MKNEILNNISEKEATELLTKHRDKILSDFAKAYIAETGLLPSKIELIHEIRQDKIDDKTKEIEVIETYYFREKVDE